MMPVAPLYILTGCTACGKTAAALAWAERHNAEIVSCDSLLFYRGMDIGTAKPTLAERARVPHHLIDFLDVRERMDVRDYVERARRALAEIVARGHVALVTGGSGFYLRSFFAPVADDVAINAELRAEIEHELATAGLPGLVRRLQELNPAGLGALDVRNPRRVVRALERCVVSGRTLRELQEAFRAQTAPFADRDVRLVELAREPDELRERIAARTQAMLANGLIDEVRALRARGLEENPSAARAIGYRETLAWLASGEKDVDQLGADIAQNTWRLVRKQRTWFRTQLPPHRVIVLRGDEMPELDGLFRDA
jgi:tRNA dimethylallyltransferase